jgi:hypothetical protein
MIPLLLTLALLMAEMPEQEVRQLQTRLATLEAKLEALHETMLAADASHARQGERLYELIRDNERLQNERLIALKERIDRSEGKASGLSQGWSVLLSLCSTGIAIAALLNARRRSAG